jgi:hypothetical protein
MDAERATEVVAAIPAKQVAAVGVELAQRGEWIVIAGFIDHISPEALATSVSQYTGEQLLRIGFVLDNLSRLDQIGTLLSGTQLDEMIAAAAGEKLWLELEELLANLAPERIARLAEHYAVADDVVKAGYTAAVKAGELSKASLAKLTS